MYTQFFGLKSEPFSIAPDPRFLYMSERHREALAHLMYGLQSDGGFVLLTGEVGTGKTTVCRCLLEQVPDKTNIAFIFNPKLTVQELLATLCDELSIDYPKDVQSTKGFVDAITRFLLQAYRRGERTVLVIDEAQQLSYRVLEQIRLLTNLETNEQKLLRIILLGQPELAEKLARPELRQLAQRITARYHLQPLTRAETASYVHHRLGVAGGDGEILSDVAIRRIHRLSEGIPRRINILCDRALLGAYVEERPQVTSAIVKRAAMEVDGMTRRAHYRVPLTAAAAVIVSLGIGAGAGYYLDLQESLPAMEAVAAAAHDESPQGSSPATLGPAQPDEPAQVSDATPANETVTEEPQELALMNPELPEDPTLTEPDWGLEWPAALPTEISHRLAFAALFDRWHTPYEVGSPVAVCDYALSVGLRCLRRSGNLRSIMALDRPAVLELADDTGARYHAVLLAIDGERADLVIGDREVTATLRELDARWLGDYTILWQMPPGYVSALREGDRGEAVEWLRARLAELSLKAPDPEVRDPAFFDPELAAMLRTFQDANGLMADGVAGTYTWIRLNSMLGLGVPRLTL